MTTDRHGKGLLVGDEVLILCVVVDVPISNDAGKVTLETIEPTWHDVNKSRIALCGSQVVRVSPMKVVD